ncbi:hypothetical protein ACSBR2_011358 [Camellia fascicularis]
MSQLNAALDSLICPADSLVWMFLLISPYFSPCVLFVSCPPNSGSPYVMQNQAEIPSVVNYLNLHIGKVVLPCGLYQNSCRDMT